MERAKTLFELVGHKEKTGTAGHVLALFGSLFFCLKNCTFCCACMDVCTSYICICLMNVGSATVSPPQPLYVYEDIPSSLTGLGSLIRVDPQVQLHEFSFYMQKAGHCLKDYVKVFVTVYRINLLITQNYFELRTFSKLSFLFLSI